MTLRILRKGDVRREMDGEKKTTKEPEYVFDTEYLKKMLQFHKQVNSQETPLGVYISSTQIDNLSMVIIQYFINLFKTKEVRSPLSQPIVMLFDPELNNNKLDIKVMSLHSTFLPKCPLFSEMPYKFNLENIDRTGLDVLFFGQDHFDTMAILDNKTKIDKENFGDQLENQRLFSNRDLMLKNFTQLIDNLDRCEKYLQDVADGNQEANTEVAQAINKCMSIFSKNDLEALKQMAQSNYKDVVMTSNLGKLQMA